MATSTVRKVYAEGLYRAASVKNEAEAAGEDLAAFVGAVEGDRRLRYFLGTPAVPSQEKQRILDRTLAGKIHPLVMNLLKLLLRKRRQQALPEIAAEYRKLLDAHLGVARGEIHSVVPIPDASRETLERAFSKRLDRKVLLTPRLDPALIGGCSVRIGDAVLDGGFRSRLAGLRRQMLSHRL